jgi:hypothetical protein
VVEKLEPIDWFIGGDLVAEGPGNAWVKPFIPVQQNPLPRRLAIAAGVHFPTSKANSIFEPRVVINPEAVVSSPPQLYKKITNFVFVERVRKLKGASSVPKISP